MKNDNGIYFVYMHKNKINGKMYVGITSNDPKTRWRDGKGYMYNKHFWNAIQKYGWDEGFEHIILYKNLTRDEACNKEIELIKEFNLTNDEFGYNVQKGGDLGSSKAVYQYNRYTGEFIKEWENTVSIEAELGILNENTSCNCLGYTKTAGGYYFSYEYKGEKLSDELIEYINSNECFKKVALYSKEGKFINIFNSAVEAAKYASGRSGTRLNFNGKISYGYICKMIEDDSIDYTKDLSEEEIYGNNTQYLDRKKMCYQYDSEGKFLRKFNSASDAARFIGGCQTCVSEACRNKNKKYYGYFWRYAKDVESTDNLSEEEVNCVIETHYDTKKVYKYSKSGDLLKIYKSVSEAARDNCTSGTNISKNCLRKTKKCKGSIFRYEGDTVTEEDIMNVDVNDKCVKVAQYDLHGNYIDTYKSITEAAKMTYISDSTIYKCCQDENKSFKGYKFKKVD